LLDCQRNIVQSTQPVLQEHGESITPVFYRHLLKEHPELASMFDARDQSDGGQTRRLAAANSRLSGNLQEAAASRRRRHVARLFLGTFGETVCRQCLIPSIIRSLRVAFHLQLATVPSWEDLSVEHSLENSFAVDGSSFSHLSSFVRCRSLLNVGTCKDHLVNPLQVCFKSNAS
jgi:hypothetical protein